MEIFKWEEGRVNIENSSGNIVSMYYLVKQYKEPSRFGINDDKILVLLIKQSGKAVYIYDRGEELKPQTPEAERALAILLTKYSSFNG